MRKTIIRITITGALAFAVLLGGYYVLILRPQIQLADAYSEAQTIILKHRAPLQENRIALMALAQTNPLRSNADDTIEDLLQTIRKTSEAGIEITKDKTQIPTISGAPTDAIAFLGRDLAPALPDLQSKQVRILKEQQPLLEILRNLYQAIAPLGTIILPVMGDLSNTDQAWRKADIANEDLNDIKRGMTTIQNDETSLIDPLLQAIEGVQQELRLFMAAIDTEDHQAAERALERLESASEALGTQTTQSAQSLFRTQEAITLLTRQTNLLLEYDFWLEKIRQRQADL